MPAQIVLAHDDADFVERAAAALRAARFNLATYTSSLAALAALEAAETVELLITRISFPAGTPHGVSLARVALRNKPGLKVLFVARAEHEEHTEGVGEFMPAPVGIPELVDRVSAMLAD